jgi:hypothetical protein
MSNKPTANLMPAMYSHRIHDIQVIGRAAAFAVTNPTHPATLG